MTVFDKFTPFSLSGAHWIITAVYLHTVTDNHDDVVSTQSRLLFAGNCEPMKGQIFFLKNLQNGQTTVLITEAADFETPAISVKNGTATLTPDNITVASTVCRDGESAVREFLREKQKGAKLYTLSNTWGDYHQWNCVSDEFIRREIDAAARLGVDAVQIDDGWQNGKTADRSIIDENGRRCFDGDFWLVDRERFPDGLQGVCDYARQKGVGIGLWFAPDFHGHFRLLERDLRVLTEAANLGCSFFKLDMLFVLDTEDKSRMLKMLDRIKPVGEVQLDVTNGVRLGFLCGAEHGTVFVENRYTKTANYYPYRTLRNLWMLSHFVPAQRLQMELVNPDLYVESYGDDVFQPQRYTMDYLFAICAAANPLFWFELQFLSDKRAQELARALPIWKSIREHLANADTVPVGETPNGTSFTGFACMGEEANYLILFRELNDADFYTFTLPKTFEKGDVLASNGTCTCIFNEKSVTVTFSQPNCYAIIRVL